jgi:O-antigen/teichoic acid export membrane protein
VSLLRRRMLFGSAWALGGRIALGLTGLATSALLGRLLSPRDFGVLFLAFSAVQFCSVFSLGLSSTALRFVAESLGLSQPGRARNVLIRILVVGAISTLTIGAIYFLFGGSILADLSRTPALSTIAGLTACWIFATSFQMLLGDIFRGFHDIRLFAIFGKSEAGFGSLTTSVLLAAGLAILWVSGGRSDLATVTFFAVGSGFTSVLLAGWMLGAKLRSLPSEEEQGSSTGYGRILRVAWPLAVSNFVSIALVQTSFWIVAAFRPETEVARYGAAWRLIALVVVPLLIVNAVVSPLVAESYAQGRTEALQKVLRSTATAAGIPALIVLLSLVLFGGPILGIVFGDYYRQASLLLMVLGLGNLVGVWVGSSGIVMPMTGHQTLKMVISVFAAATTIAAGFISVRYYGALGVAVCTAAGMALQSVLEWLGTRFTTGMWTHMSPGSIPQVVRTLRGK